MTDRYFVGKWAPDRRLRVKNGNLVEVEIPYRSRFPIMDRLTHVFRDGNPSAVAEITTYRRQRGRKYVWHALIEDNCMVTGARDPSDYIGVKPGAFKSKQEAIDAALSLYTELRADAPSRW